MLNTTLLILILIISLVVSIITLSIKKITLLEGVITLLVSIVALVIVWTMAINTLIHDEYITYTKITDIVTNEDTSTHYESCECNKEGDCKQCSYKLNHLKVYIQTKDGSKLIHEETSRDPLTKPTWIDKKYKVGDVITKSHTFKNIYDNLGQYRFSSFPDNKPINNHVIDVVNGFSHKELNQNIETLNIRHGLNIFIVFTDDSTNTLQILDKWNGIKLNEILVHIIKGTDVTNANIVTHAGNMGNETFTKRLQSELQYTSFKDSEIFKVISDNIGIYRLPSDSLFDDEIQNVKPDAWLLFSILLLNILLTSAILYIMYLYNRNYKDLSDGV